jgi:hypothetical protein
VKAAAVFLHELLLQGDYCVHMHPVLLVLREEMNVDDSH